MPSYSIAALLVAGLTSGVCAQPFSYAEDDNASDAVGPQNVRGKPTRAESDEHRAQEPDDESPSEAGAPGDFWHWDRVTGDWGGARTKMEQAGLTLEASFTADWFGVLDGGVRRSSETMTIADLNLTLDLETVAGWQGASVFADLYWTDGDSISALAGDVQGVSNIEADNRFQLAELWYEQVMFDGALRLKVGKIEANSEFAFVDAAGEFINSSAGFSPTLIALPTFPDPSTGIILSWSPNDRFSLTAGFMDGAATVDGVTTGDLGPSTFFDDDVSDDYVWMLEANLSWDGGRAGVGVWHHTGDFARFSGGMDDGATGFYALAEHRVWSPGDDRGIDLFAQFGLADDEVSEVEYHLSLGAAWWGPFEGRPGDSVGLYASTAFMSEPAGFTDDETVIELYYNFQVTPAVAIKPDIQYVIDPGGSSAVDDALVAGVRVQVTF